MRRLAVSAAVAILAAACSSDPILATDLEPATGQSSSSTTLAATTTTTTTIKVAATTTVDPGPNVSDLLRIAHDHLYEFDSVRYAALTDTSIDIVGQTRQTVVGQWNRDGTSTLRIGFDFDGRIAEAVVAAMAGNPEDVAAVIEGLSEGIFYRFPDDGFAWFSPSTLSEWRGVPKESFGDGDVDLASDALTYLDPLFNAIIEIDPEPSLDASGHTVYQLVLDADVVVPVMAIGANAKALIDAGYDATSEATTTGTVTLDDDGALVGAFVDQTPWWRAGWDAAGVGDLVAADAAVHWTMSVTASQQQVPVVAPCDDPGTEPDPELGVDVLTCL